MSDDLQHFSMGTWIVALAAVTAFIGVFVGIASARKAVTAPNPRQRYLWLAWGALSIGGIGAWLPHYIAMVGFEVYGSVVRYDVLWIVISFVVPVAAAAVALLIISPPPTKHRMPSSTVEMGRLAGGAVLLGVGFAGMHLAIVSSLEIQGSVGFDPLFTAAAAVIGLLVGAGIMWSISALESRTLRLIASVVVAVGLVAMHYTGVFGLSVTVDPTMARPDGLEVFSILFPVFVLGMLVVTIPITALLMAPDRVAAELELEADMLAAESLAAESRGRELELQ
ncbi:MHYT domain-containing protein [Rhodococcus jostii]|uniref:MHYT domain-containing protein, NO-binding membrane sensor n=1 Tax=Rhodococcus jostii TaxID=132919 RepID=A0A1H5DF77_RHOJO|nr:MHYT domain-containing protein [Rhodococcus jostii]SED77583.1 MHYT domain-containing protein, NO-binding membrane sensor [Rhodococcus jostii]